MGSKYWRATRGGKYYFKRKFFRSLPYQGPCFCFCGYFLRLIGRACYVFRFGEGLLKMSYYFAGQATFTDLPETHQMLRDTCRWSVSNRSSCFKPVITLLTGCYQFAYPSPAGRGQSIGLKPYPPPLPKIVSPFLCDIFCLNFCFFIYTIHRIPFKLQFLFLFLLCCIPFSGFSIRKFSSYYTASHSLDVRQRRNLEGLWHTLQTKRHLGILSEVKTSGLVEPKSGKTDSSFLIAW